MKKIEILSNGQTYIAEFDTQAELDEWKADQIAKGRWDNSDITFEGDKEVSYVRSRQIEYSKLDNMLKEALVEKELGDSTKWNEYIDLREQIKINYPKP